MPPTIIDRPNVVIIGFQNGLVAANYFARQAKSGVEIGRADTAWSIFLAYQWDCQERLFRFDWSIGVLRGQVD